MSNYNPETYKKWYDAHREEQYARNKARQDKLVAWLAAYRSQLACQVCGEDHVACLDFHHRDPATKDVSIAQAIYVKGWGKKRILEEIDKCDVLCSNCHRKEHHRLRSISGDAPLL